MALVFGRRLTALLTTLVVLAAPAAALADGAGDQQYQDPLTAPGMPHKKKQPNAATAPAATAPATPAAPHSESTPATPSAASKRARRLPRTGAPIGLVALVGATLIAAGLALRRPTALL